MSNNVTEGHKNKQSYANDRTTGKEQYYTSPETVDTCLQEVRNHIDLTGRKILEPCGGTGEFIEGFRRIGIHDSLIESCDIEPKHPSVQQGDYLETSFETKNYVTITNPPFGRASQLAKKFFNHAADHCDYICYLIPKSWRKWSTQNSLDERFHLIADIEMPKNCFYLPDGTKNEKDVLNTVFQIWEKREVKRKKIKIPDNKMIKKIQPTKKIVTDKNGKKVKRPNKITGVNFEIIVFGHSCGKCRDLDPKLMYDAKTTTMYLDIQRQDVKDFIKHADFSKYYNNVSYVQALSIEEINYEINKHFNLKNFVF